MAGTEHDDAPHRSGPGSSAEREYEELRRLERERRRAHRIRTSILLVIVPAGLGIGVLVGCNALSDGLATTANPHPISAGVSRLLAALIAGTFFLIIASEAWGSSEDVVALRRDAVSERSTAEILQRLGRDGWAALHDRRFPRSTRNVDHIAVGPTGIAVIESRSWTGRVVVTRRRIRHNGHRVEGLVGQLQDEIAAVELLLADLEPVPVFAVVCVHGAHVEHRRGLIGVLRRRKATPGGVEVCSRRRLRKLLRDRPTVEGLDVDQITRILDEALPPAV